MDAHETTSTSPGPLRDDKTAESAPPAQPEPEAAEVESARLLENKTRDELLRRGLDEGEIRQLAGRFIAEDRGQEPEVFVGWAVEHRHPA